MSRLAMLYALTDDETEALCAMPEDERYDYMLNDIEEEMFGTARACELDKAWEGIQYCLCGGDWSEENSVPANIVYGGRYLVDSDDAVMTLKDHDAVRAIDEFLRKNKLSELIEKNFWKIDDEDFRYKDADGLEHTLGWSEGIQAFYENARKENCQVIFTVDF